ncbi:MAG: 50S ribosomal protein L7 [Candidatus Krumholzibacteria bacterium]|nr:50S ribosomal protein L7 [Candidatus Krumholzibacteria bacterium]
MGDVDQQKLLGLLGLARRAGKLAVGFTAVEKIVRRGESPMVIVASDMGASQMSKVNRWEPLRGTLNDVFTAEELALAMGREKLSVVGVSDAGFVKGIKKLVAGGSGS